MPPALIDNEEVSFPPFYQQSPQLAPERKQELEYFWSKASEIISSSTTSNEVNDHVINEESQQSTKNNNTNNEQNQQQNGRTGVSSITASNEDISQQLNGNSSSSSTTNASTSNFEIDYSKETVDRKSNLISPVNGMSSPFLNGKSPSPTNEIHQQTTTTTTTATTTSKVGNRQEQYSSFRHPTGMELLDQLKTRSKSIQAW